jgi:long-chain acyl-CoA synthetase
VQPRQFNTLIELFLEAAESRPKPACFLVKSAGRYQGVSSHQALRAVAALAVWLDRAGIRAGSRVALLSENRLEWALTDYAILSLGAVTVPLYPTLLEPDVEYILRDSGAEGIVVSTRAQVEKVLNVASALPSLRFVVAMDGGGFGGSRVQSWKAAAQSEQGSEPEATARLRQTAGKVRPEDVASILYTSGTTGRPKGVVLTHRNIVSNIIATRELFPLSESDVGLSFLPLSHVYERMFDFYYLAVGVSIAYVESLEALPRNLLEVRPTVMAVVPRILEKVHVNVLEKVGRAAAWQRRLFHWSINVGRRHFSCVNQGRKPPLALQLARRIADRLVYSKIRAQMGGRLRFLVSGAAPLAPDLAEFFFAIGLPVYEGYGLTETSPVIAVNAPGAVRVGTVGRVIPGVEVKLGEAVVDELGGTGREILVRGPNVSSGYYHLDAENREAFVDGWFRTGDLGVLDGDGFLAITGRKKNLFKTSGGKYVSPELLENLFQGHPYVAQLVVLGEARKFVGALIVPKFAALELAARQQGISFASRAELVRNAAVQAWMQSQVDEACRGLAPHQRIRQIVLLAREFTIESGELSATLKVRRSVVERNYRDLIEEMFQRPAPEPQAASATAR